MNDEESRLWLSCSDAEGGVITGSRDDSGDKYISHQMKLIFFWLFENVKYFDLLGTLKLLGVSLWSGCSRQISIAFKVSKSFACSTVCRPFVLNLHHRTCDPLPDLTAPAAKYFLKIRNIQRRQTMSTLKKRLFFFSFCGRLLKPRLFYLMTLNNHQHLVFTVSFHHVLDLLSLPGVWLVWIWTAGSWCAHVVS